MSAYIDQFRGNFKSTLLESASTSEKLTLYIKQIDKFLHKEHPETNNHNPGKNNVRR